MAPPCVLGEIESPTRDLEDAAYAPHLIEARDVLDDRAAALAIVVFLFVRIHRGTELRIKPERGGIVREPYSHAEQSLDYLDRKRADPDLVDLRPQDAGGAEVVLPALMPDRDETVLHVLVRILSDSHAQDRVAVADVVNADIDALGPFRVVRMNPVHRGRKLMAHHFVP